MNSESVSSENTVPVTGHDFIRGQLRLLDNSPGVYRMLDAQGAVLYVGKAKSLQARVSSYARRNGHSARIAKMISETVSMMFLTTNTESEALLLEHNLIKQLKPRYNVLLRDDKSFPNILLTRDHPFPQIKKHRGAKSQKGDYFGPFASVGAVNRTLNQLQRVFLLRNCTDAVFGSRTRPCLLYQIKRCSGPCVGKVSEEEYGALVDDAVMFLRGRTTSIQAGLAKQMAQASEDMEYERAAALRDRISALTAVQTTQSVNPRIVAEADVVALHMEGGQACVQVFFIRGNRNWGNRDFYPRLGGAESPAEVMQAFLVQFYSDKVPPQSVLLSDGVEDEDVLASVLSDKAGRKVELAVPQRGEKFDLVQNALRNARESLARKMAESAAQGRLLQGIAEAFDLAAPPARIEVYDNSHIQGAHPVGGMIVSGPEGLMKNQYRKFNIKGTEITPGDDFGMMREVLNRRFTRLLKEDPDRKEDGWPDLLLIDGGAGQVSAVQGILDDIGVHGIPVLGVAKGQDRDHGKEVFHRTGMRPIALAMNDPVLYFIQRLRDEAHRWAIGAHRARRSKAITATRLDDIPGVGATRKRQLLAHFGSAKAVSGASIEELRVVEGISDRMARVVYDYFHPDS